MYAGGRIDDTFWSGETRAQIDLLHNFLWSVTPVRDVVTVHLSDRVAALVHALNVDHRVLARCGNLDLRLVDLLHV